MRRVSEGQKKKIRRLKLNAPKAVRNLKNENADITQEEIAKSIGDCDLVSEAVFPLADSIDEAHAAASGGGDPAGDISSMDG